MAKNKMPDREAGVVVLCSQSGNGTIPQNSKHMNPIVTMYATDAEGVLLDEFRTDGAFRNLHEGGQRLHVLTRPIVSRFYPYPDERYGGYYRKTSVEALLEGISADSAAAGVIKAMTPDMWGLLNPETQGQLSAQIRALNADVRREAKRKLLRNLQQGHNKAILHAVGPIAMMIADAPDKLEERASVMSAEFSPIVTSGYDNWDRHLCVFSFQWVGVRVGLLAKYTNDDLCVYVPSSYTALGKGGATMFSILSELQTAYGVRLLTGAVSSAYFSNKGVLTEPGVATISVRTALHNDVYNTLTVAQMKYERARKLKLQYAMCIEHTIRKWKKIIKLFPEMEHTEDNYQALLLRIEAGTDLRKICHINRGAESVLRLKQTI